MLARMTIQLEFTPEIQAALEQARYQYPHPMVQRRMETLWLKSHDLPHAQIAELAGVSENTMRDYFRLYQEGGLAKLKELHPYRPASALQAYATSLEAHFRDHPPATIKEAQSEITRLTDIQRSETQVRHFLHDQLGMRCRKVGMIPAKADPDAQATYKQDVLEPRNPAWPKPKPAPGPCSLWMRRTSSWRPFSACCGVSSASSSKRRRVGSGSTSWAP